MAAKQNAARTLNEQPGRGWAKIHSPRYRAIEDLDEPGTFTCRAKGPGLWTVEQLQAWAELVGAEVVLTLAPPVRGGEQC
jgi:hypothetical protein